MTELDERFGLNRGPALLGRSYKAMAQIVEAAWNRAMNENVRRSDLSLLARTMSVLTSDSEADLAVRLEDLADLVNGMREEIERGIDHVQF